MTDKTNKEAQSTEQQVAQVMSLVEQLRTEFKQERQELQTRINQLEARLAAQTANPNIEGEKEDKTSRRKMLRKLGAAAAGIAAIGVATNALQPDSAFAAPNLELNINNTSSTANTKVTAPNGSTHTVFSVESGSTTASADGITAFVGGGVGVVGESVGQGSGVVGYQGNRGPIDSALGSTGGNAAGVTGASLSKTGVQGLSQTKTGVRAISLSGIGLTSRAGLQAAYFASTGSYGQIVMRPGTTAGGITTGEHYLGELYLDSNYDLWVLKSGGTSLTDGELSPDGDGLPKPFVPLASDWRKLNGTGGGGGGGGGTKINFLTSPVRVAATTNSGGSLPLLVSTGNPANIGTGQLVTITGSSVPAGAVGIICSLTSVGATTSGNLRIWPGDGNAPTVNSLNIPTNVGNQLKGFNLTTAATVALSPAGQVRIAYNNSTANSTCGFSIDVVAYLTNV